MIVFSKVTKKFPDGSMALEDVSFTIEKGGFAFLIGPSGSGKTTISRILIGEIPPTDGRIFVDNEEITKIKKSKISNLRHKIGVAFQDFKLLWDRTVIENIRLPLEITGQKEKNIKERVNELLVLVGLETKGNCFPKQLSGGEIQRVVIARALAHDPKILFADEPTGNLDQETAWQIINLLKKINEQGTTVLVATHNNLIIQSMTERIIHLTKGKVKTENQKEKTEQQKEKVTEEKEEKEVKKEQKSESKVTKKIERKEKEKK